MKIKITTALLLLLFSAAFTAQAQIRHNMLVIKPITGIIKVGGSLGTIHGVYIVPIDYHGVYQNGLPFAVACFGGNTLTYFYTSSNGGSYAAKTFSPGYGLTLSVPAGTLNPAGGSITFTFSGNVPTVPIGSPPGTSVNYTFILTLAGISINGSISVHPVNDGNGYGCPDV